MTIYNSTMDTFDKCEHRNPKWFEEDTAELKRATMAKRAGFIYKRDPTDHSLAALRKARSDAQQITWCCANDFWSNLCESIQVSADCGNICSMHDSGGW